MNVGNHILNVWSIMSVMQLNSSFFFLSFQRNKLLITRTSGNRSITRIGRMIPFILIFQSGKEVYPTSSLLLVVDSGRFCAGIIIGFSRIGVQAPKRHSNRQNT